MKIRQITLYFSCLIMFTNYLISMEQTGNSKNNIAGKFGENLHDRLKAACREKNLDKFKNVLASSSTIKIIKLSVLRAILFDAVLSGDVNILKECIAQIIVNMPSSGSSERQLISQFINAQDKDGQTLLMLACANNFEDIVQYLILAGANLDIKNNFDENVSNIITKLRHFNLLKYLDDLYWECFKELKSVLKPQVKSSTNLNDKGFNESDNAESSSENTSNITEVIEIDSDNEPMEIEEQQTLIKINSEKDEKNTSLITQKRKRAQSSSTKQHSKKRRISQNKEKRIYKCDFAGCSKVYKSCGGLRGHKKGQHGGGFKCDVEGCGKVYTAYSNLRMHKKGEHGGGFKCDVEGCDKVFKHSIQLRDHKKGQHDGGFKCDIEGCKNIFANRQGLWYHKKRVHECGFKCNAADCGKIFPNRNRLRDHKNHFCDFHVKNNLLNAVLSGDLQSLKKYIIQITANMLDSEESEQTILEFINAQDQNGQTLLMIACANNLEDIVQYLILKGTKVDTKNNSGETAFEIVKKSGFKNLLQYFD